MYMLVYRDTKTEHGSVSCSVSCVVNTFMLNTEANFLVFPGHSKLLYKFIVSFSEKPTSFRVNPIKIESTGF